MRLKGQYNTELTLSSRLHVKPLITAIRAITRSFLCDGNSGLSNTMGEDVRGYSKCCNNDQVPTHGSSTVSFYSSTKFYFMAAYMSLLFSIKKVQYLQGVKKNW